jgi:HEAT repeat protein
VRAQAALSIGELGVRNQNVYSQLMSSLKNDPSPIVQQDVIYTLKKLNYKKASDTLVEKLRSSPHEDVRADAAFALEELGSGKGISALKKGLNDSSRRVQFASRSTLEALPQYDVKTGANESTTQDQEKDVTRASSRQQTRTEEDKWWMIR